MGKHLKLWETSALLALSVTLLMAAWAQRSQSRREGQVIRLHVIAADDTREEQAVKLRVRDAVLRYTAPVLEGTQSAAEAVERLYAALPEIAQAAYGAAEGRTVTVTFSPAVYGARALKGGVLPAGRYESLRVTLGDGAGHNWWGLLYPEFCLPCADAERGTVAALKQEGVLLVPEEEGVRLRLYVLDCWTGFKAWLCGDTEKPIA